MVERKIILGDARNLDQIEDSSVHCIVTSPPYYANRAYGDDPREIGLGDLVDYYKAMDECATEWHRKLTDDGVLWFNTFDTASGSGGAGGDYNKGGSKDGRPKWRQGKVDRPRMNWLNVPHNTIEVFVQAGFYYRHCIIWEKVHGTGSPVLRREDLKHVRRPGISHEYIFMLSKTPDYRFFPDRLAEKGSVWAFPPATDRTHQAPFPIELPWRCIQLTTEPGDVVLDPFMGSGTTLDAATQLGRNAIGVDLYTA